MPIQRVFIDWSQPALPLVASELLQRSRSSLFYDLSHLLVVLPGGQAGRRLLELLAEQSSGKVSPPRIITVGALPEFLYTPQRPFATTLTQNLVWVEALQALPADTFEILARRPPDPGDLDGWLRLGDLLRRQHTELAADGLDFQDVRKRGASLKGFDEVQRWTVLAEIQQSYLRRLDGLGLWDQQTARLKAIEFQECRTDLEIVTVGTVDLSGALRSMLDQVAGAGRVTAYIHAPEDWKDRFDEHGCLIPQHWENVPIELAPGQVRLADDAAGQTQAVLQTLAELQQQYSVEDITITVPDQQLVKMLQRTLQQYGVPTFWPVDRLLSESAPARLLSAVADYLDEGDSASFAALIRHPDVGAWLARQGFDDDFLSAWDKYISTHLQRRTVSILNGGEQSQRVRKLIAEINRMLRPLTRRARLLCDWEGPIGEFLRIVYEGQTFHSDDPARMQVLDACGQLQQAFAEHATIPAALSPQKLTVAEAIRLTLNDLTTELYRNETEPAVRLAGWLEMPLDDAEVAIVTSFNEGFIPSAVNHDLFLPNRLRSHLGIEDNARRYARDVYILSVLLHSRSRVQLIAGRRSLSGDPLIPSRLLFATEPEQIAERIISFYDRPPAQADLPPPSMIAEVSGFRIPRPLPRPAPPQFFRVTEFRDYMASPYRYYLRHVLRLQELTDDLDELDASAFGMLMHEVLKRFGSGESRHSSDAQEIEALLDRVLAETVEECYGSEPLAAVMIQTEQARRRLGAFARWQAAWRRQGWEIHSVEQEDLPPAEFSLGDGRTILLKGRMDRIDYHPQTGTWAILDYKTGDGGTPPDQTHRWHGDWYDLQLPLYRHLARAAGIEGDLRLGYLLLPRDTDGVKEEFADWSEEDLHSADEEARRIARCILNEEFWEVLVQPPQTLSEYDRICQAGVFGPEAIV